MGGGERGGCSVAEKRVKKGEGEGGEWKKRMVEEKRLRRDKQDGRREGGRERRERRRRGCGKGEGIEGKEEKREKWKVKKEQKCMYTRINKSHALCTIHSTVGHAGCMKVCSCMLILSPTGALPCHCWLKPAV